MVDDARRRAIRSGRPFTLTREDVQKQLERGVCAVTGLPFVFETGSPYVPSLDRIDNQKGYTPDNTQVVVLIYNTCKSAGTHEDVLTLCRALYAV